jgi:hypothetical protein
VFVLDLRSADDEWVVSHVGDPRAPLMSHSNGLFVVTGVAAPKGKLLGRAVEA